MNLTTRNPRETLRLYLGFLLLVGLCFYAFGLRPAIARLQVARLEYEGLRRDITTGKSKTQELVDYARRVERLKAEVAKLDQQLKPGNQVLLLFKDAEAAAAQAGVDLLAINPGVAAAQDDVTKQPVALVAAGKLDNLLRFIKRIEQLPYPVNVAKLDLKVSDTQLAADLDLELYSLKVGGGK